MSISLFTLDVGHGLCQILLLPRRRAVIVDGGDWFASDVVSEFLQQYVDVIEAYILTHNDRDHYAAAVHFLALPKFNNAQTLRNVWALIDRGSHSAIPFVDYTMLRYQDGTIGGFYYGSLVDSPRLRPRSIYRNKSERVSVDLLYPRSIHNIPALRARTTNARLQNRTSACIRVRVGRHVALITGDIDLVGLSRIIDDYGFDLSAQVLTVPHHGGRIPGERKTPKWATVVAAIGPKYGLISCGIKGRVAKTVLCRETLTGLVENSVVVACTEMTRKCYEECHRLQGPASRRLIPFAPALAMKHDVRDVVACMGTILIEFSGKRLVLWGEQSHRVTVDNIATRGGNPMCRLC